MTYVLSTEFLQSSKNGQFLQNLEKIRANYPDAAFLSFECRGDDARKLVYSVTNVMYALNQSRPLRRAKVSGIRACCLNTEEKRFRYYCDFGFTSFFGASLIASGLIKYFSPTFVDVHFSPANISGRGRKQALFNLSRLYSEKFYSQSGLSKYSVVILDVTEETYIAPSVSWRIQSPRADLLDIVNSLEFIFGKEIEQYDFYKGAYKVSISRSILFDQNKYVERSIDKAILGFRFKRFTSFGRFHHNPDYTIY